MAQLSSFATTASNVSTDNATRTITITSEVVEIDGLLDPPTGFSDWGGWTILCQSSGGFRSTSGANGTLGGGTSALRIVEATNGHRFGGDNFSNSNGANARFAGDATNTLKYNNIVWIVESGGRSDFDIGRGSSADGSSGCKVELSGVALYQQYATGGSGHFNHYSGQASIKIHSGVGYGLRIENRTNGPSIEFSTPIHTGAVVEGLVIANVTANENNNGSRAAVRLERVPENGTMVLSNLNTPSIANVNSPNNDLDRDSTKTLLLIDPVGLPSRNDWSGRYHGNFEIRRNVPFNFTSADPSGATMRAIAQTSGGQDASSTMSGSRDTIQVRTQYSPHQDSGSSTWTNYNTYRFFMAGLDFQKYSLTSTQTIGNSPDAIDAALTADLLPDGTKISAITAPTNNNPPDTLSEVIRAIKDIEVANPVTTGYPTTSLAYVDGNAVKINTSYSLDLNSGNSTLIYVENNPAALGGLHIDLKTATTLGDSNGLTTIDATGTGKVITTYSVTEDNDVFLKDSTGQKSVVNVTNNMGADDIRFAVVNSSNGTTIAHGDIDNGESGNLVISTKGLTTGYKLVAKRPGYNYFSADVDLTGGGLKSFSAPAQTQIVQPDGSASYQNVTVPNTLTVSFTNSGTTPIGRIECGNATFSARQIFKAYEDEMATADGDKYMGLGGAQMTYTLSALKGNEIVLGAHTKIMRKASGDSNATVRATLYAPDDAPIYNPPNTGNGDVMTIEGLDVTALSEELWTYDDRTLTSGGGGGSNISTDDIWGHREVIQTYTPSSLVDGDLVLPGNEENDFTTGDPVRLDNNGGYTGADNGAELFARNAGAAIQLFRDYPTAIAGTQNARVRLTGSGTVGNIRLSRMTTTAIDRINSIPDDVWGRSTRTITGGAPTTSQIANAVWSADDRQLTSTGGTTPEDVWNYRTQTSMINTPSGVNSDGDMQFSSEDRAEMNAKVVRINATGGYSEISVGDLYWARNTGTVLHIYENQQDYLLSNTSNRTTLNSSGQSNQIRVAVMSDTALINMRDIPSEVWGVNNRQLSGTQLTVNNIATGVWGATNRTLSDTDNIWSNSNALTASDIWTNSTRTITGGAPTAAENAAAVWGTDIQVISNTSTTFSPQIVTGSFLILNSAEDTVGMENGDPIGIDDDGGYTNLIEGTTYYARPNGTLLELYADRNDAINGTGTAIFPVDGVASSLVLSVTRQSVTRNLGDASSVLKDILLDTEAVISPPTAMAISNAVWSEIIDGSITGELIVDAESEAGDGFVIPNEDAALIANGDPFTFTNNGDYTNLALNTTYYAYIGNGQNDTKVLYVYTSRDSSLTPGAAWIRPNGSDASSVRMVFPEDRPIGTAGVAMHRILAAIEELDQDHDTHSANTESIRTSINNLMGTGFVESGLSLKEALQICTAILAGKLSVNNNGNEFTFHRLDTGETAVIRATTSDNGRGSPTRNPT